MLFVIRNGRREFAHWNITEHPTARWVCQQLWEAFPYDSASRYLVFDRDTIFSAEVASAVQAMNIRPTRTSYRSPWQNGVAERFVGTVRRELLDHIIVLDDRHLRRLLGEYIGYYLKDRTHLRLDKDAPWTRLFERVQRGTPDRGSVGSTIAIAGTRPRRPSSATDRHVPAGPMTSGLARLLWPVLAAHVTYPP